MASTMSLTLPLVIEPTWTGSLETAEDPYYLLEAVLSGELWHIPRFPREKDLPVLLRSGNMFVSADPPTGRGQWDDGKSWRLVRHVGCLAVECERTGPSALWRKSGVINYKGVNHHIVAYYSPDDETLQTPEQSSDFPLIPLRSALAKQLDTAVAQQGREEEESGGSKF